MTVTDKALTKLFELRENPTQGLRIAIRGGGCSGFQYALHYDFPKEGDQIQEIGSSESPMTILMDPMSAMYLQEVQLDYIEGLNGSGFKIINPNATGSCGCGQSFSV